MMPTNAMTPANHAATPADNQIGKEARIPGTQDRGALAPRQIGYAIPLTLLLALLLTLGMINLYSASSGGQLFYTQLRHLPLGVIAFLICGFLIKPRHLSSYAYLILGITVVALLGVLITGQIGGGSRRWLELGPLRIQPSELAKITVAIVTARYFSTFGLNVTYHLSSLWPLGLLIASVAGLVFPQPDLGTATFLLMIVSVQLCFVNIGWKSLTIAFGSLAALAPILWHFLLMDYQKARILSFLNPAFDPQGKGWNSLQSLVAVGSGGMMGKGFMNGTQTQLRFLPMSHSDFIFSVFAEEHGFLGGVLLFLVFAAIGYLALEIARASRSSFSALLAVGLGAFIFLEFTINIAMVLRMMPVKGLPLPFMSYGGSHLITSCTVIGILVAIDRESRFRYRKLRSDLYR